MPRCPPVQVRVSMVVDTRSTHGQDTRGVRHDIGMGAILCRITHRCRVSRGCGRCWRAPLPASRLRDARRARSDGRPNRRGPLRDAAAVRALVGFICLAALGLVVIDYLNAPRDTTANRPRLRDLCCRCSHYRSAAASGVARLVARLQRWPVRWAHWCGYRWRRCKCGCCGRRA